MRSLAGRAGRDRVNGLAGPFAPVTLRFHVGRDARQVRPAFRCALAGMVRSVKEKETTMATLANRNPAQQQAPVSARIRSRRDRSQCIILDDRTTFMRRLGMEGFTRLDLAVWGRATADLTPDEIIRRLAAEAQEAVANWALLSIDLDPATDPEHAVFQRVSAEIPVSLKLFDAFFNGRAGYRAQYAVSKQAGERFNRSAIQMLAPILGPLEHLYVGGFSRSFCDTSLDGPYTKLWFPRSITDPVAKSYLLSLPEDICVAKWQSAWRMDEPPRKGLLAPISDPPAILLNGTFFRPGNSEPWNQKPLRSDELHNEGWT